MSRKAPKRRTNVYLETPVEAAKEEGKKATSGFMITINPNMMFWNGTGTAEAKQMTAKLTALGDFLLKKKSILAGLTFKDPKPKEGEAQLHLSREEHLSRIISINDEDRDAAVEIGKIQKKIHLHVAFIIEHRTFLHLNREYYLDMAEIFLGIPRSKIHLHFNGSTLNRDGYKKYVRKGEENKVHFLDNAVSHFHKG